MPSAFSLSGWCGEEGRRRAAHRADARCLRSGSPELAVAVSVRGVPTVCVPGLLNVIVCEAGLTVKVAELLVTLPAELLTVTVNDEPLSAVVVAGVV